jgi:hypothetical protein
VLAEFGLALPPATRVAVHDSTADMRYLVLPEQPPVRVVDSHPVAKPAVAFGTC